MNRINPIALLVLLSLAPHTSYAICNSEMQPTAPAERYIDNGDGTVTDTRTQLMWMQCSAGLTTTNTACDTGSAQPYSWGSIPLVVTPLNSAKFAGFNDWRLPNRNELASLVEYQCVWPSINSDLFPSTELFPYWTTTPYVTIGARAWAVSFADGGTTADNKSNTYYLRLVRNAN